MAVQKVGVLAELMVAVTVANLVEQWVGKLVELMVAMTAELTAAQLVALTVV